MNNELKSYIENYDNLEYESIEGGQDVYSFILAIE